VETFPAGLLCAEPQSGSTPLATYEFMTASGSHNNEILLKILGDKTKQEKPKNGLIRLMFRTRTI
jgi:hypothetical protein